MKLFNILLLLFFSIALFSSSAYGATIYGNIYDLSLNKVSGAEIEVNTTPSQYLISKAGTYSLELPDGFYTIKATLSNGNSNSFETRNITISQDGNYIIDFILFPGFEEEDDISKDPQITIPETEEKSFAPIFILVFVFILVIIAFIILKSKKRQKTDKNELTITEDRELSKEDKETIKKDNETVKEDEEEKKHYGENLSDIIEIIKQEGGRTTQKEIRKKIPLSEAKISLMISELEHKDIIQKIKKGRGNILILKQK